MKVFFYIGTRNQGNRAMEKVVAAVARMTDVEVYRDLEMLARWFGRPRFVLDQPIMVLVPGGKRDLVRIASMNAFLEEVPLILVLPDTKEETAVLGHTLRPRYVSYRDGDFEDVAAVLGRMLMTEEEAA